jgi:hypothetical protein
MYSLSVVASLVCGMNVAKYKHQPFGKDLAQFGEIVLHNLVESVRSQNVVHISEHIADTIVPLLHRLVEPEVCFAEILESVAPSPRTPSPST